MIYVDMIVTFLVAALSGLGIGSGGLLVLYLTFLRGTEQLPAQAMNLLFFLFASSASMSVHLARRKFYPLLSVFLILAGIPGALLGTKAALLLPGKWTGKIFGAFLVLAGLSSLLSSFLPKKEDKICQNNEKN